MESPRTKRRRLYVTTPGGSRLVEIMTRRGLSRERAMLTLDLLGPDAKPEEVARYLRDAGTDPATIEAIASELAATPPSTSETLAAIVRSRGGSRDAIGRTLAMVDPPSDEEQIAAALMRIGVPTPLVEQTLKEYRAMTQKVSLTVYGKPEYDEEDWAEDPEGEMREGGLSSENFWIESDTKVEDAVKEAIEVADRRYFQFSFPREESSTEVWASWKNSPEALSGAIRLYEGDYVVPREANLLDVLIEHDARTARGDESVVRL